MLKANGLWSSHKWGEGQGSAFSLAGGQHTRTTR